MNTIPIGQRVTWHNVLLGASVWAIRRADSGKRRSSCCAAVFGCRVKFIDTNNCAFRGYQELAGRSERKRGSDKPPLASSESNIAAEASVR
jgi:hypothetical protein